MEPGMPQLQPNDFAPQLFWLAITFALLYIALSRFALPRIEKVLGQRSTRIGGDLDNARRAQQESEKAMQRYEAEIAAAKTKGQAALRAQREKLEAELAEKRGHLDRQVADKNADTEKRVRSLLERAENDMESMTSGVVNDIVKRFAGVDVSADEIRAALRKRSGE
jgi:F-type H+-transporting ATPase subunit b